MYTPASSFNISQGVPIRCLDHPKNRFTLIGTAYRNFWKFTRTKVSSDARSIVRVRVRIKGDSTRKRKCNGLPQTEQFRPRDACPDGFGRRRHSSLSRIFHLKSTVAAPQIPWQRESDRPTFDSLCHKRSPRRLAYQPCQARRARRLAV